MRYSHETSLKDISHQNDISTLLDDLSLSGKTTLALLLLRLSTLAENSCGRDFGHFVAISCVKRRIAKYPAMMLTIFNTAMILFHLTKSVFLFWGRN